MTTALTHGRAGGQTWARGHGKGRSPSDSEALGVVAAVSNFADLLDRYWGYAVTAGAGLFAAYKQLQLNRERKAEVARAAAIEAAAVARGEAKERVDLVQIAQRIAGEMIEDLRQEVTREREESARLRERVAVVEDELDEVRRGFQSMVEAKDAEIALLRGRVQELAAVAAAYERLLDANNIPHERPNLPFWSVPAGKGPVDVEPRGGAADR